MEGWPVPVPVAEVHRVLVGTSTLSHHGFVLARQVHYRF